MASDLPTCCTQLWTTVSSAPSAPALRESALHLRLRQVCVEARRRQPRPPLRFGGRLHGSEGFPASMAVTIDQDDEAPCLDHSVQVWHRLEHFR